MMTATLTKDAVRRVGLKAVNLAREAFDDAGHQTSLPGDSEPGEFYVLVDGVSIAVKVEVL